VALRQEIAAQAVGDLAGINPIVLLLRRCDGTQHQRMRHFDLLRMRQQMIVEGLQKPLGAVPQGRAGSQTQFESAAIPGFQFRISEPDS
jgi:hypothetical protein